MYGEIPMAFLDEDYYYQNYSQMGGVLLTVLELDTVDRPRFQQLLLNFGPFRHIFGPPSQLLRLVSSEQLVCLCFLEIPKYTS